MMTHFQKILSMNISGFAQFLSKISNDETPWNDWFDKTYCQKCDSVTIAGRWGDMEASPCEVGDCPFGMKDIDEVKIIEMWLNEKA